jgi:predicted double-glycine peptidase
LWTSNALSLAYNRPMISLNDEQAASLLVVARRIVPEVVALADRAAEGIRANAGELLRQ